MNWNIMMIIQSTQPKNNRKHSNNDNHRIEKKTFQRYEKMDTTIEFNC